MITDIDIITRARGFASRSLFGNISSISMDDYCLFTISKFLLLKESIIKKNYKRNTIYFDVEKNKKYLDAIISIVNYVKNNGTIEVGERLRCVLTPASYNSDRKLLFYIKAFHKIRDALAHGQYEIVPNKGIIKINNEKDGYEVSVNLPIQLLERFGYISENRISNKKYNESTKYLDKTFFKNDKEPYKKEIIDGIMIEANDYKFNKYNYIAYALEQIQSLIEKSSKKGFNSSDIELINESILKLFQIILNYNDLPRETRIMLLSKLKELIEIYKSYSNVKYEKNIEIYSKDALLSRTSSAIAEIAKLLHITRDSTQALESSAVYNYMQTFLSFKMEEIEKIKEDDEKILLGSLKMSNLNFSIKNSPSYDTQVRTINRVVKEQVEFINAKLRDYNKHPIVRLRDEINNAYNNELLKRILISLGERNKVIIGSIRNAIDHGNITVEDNKMKLEDYSLKDNGTREKEFICEAEPKELFDLTYHLDTKTPYKDFDFNDVLLEINDILDEDVRLSLYEVTNNVRQMNELCLLDDLKQIMRKR